MERYNVIRKPDDADKVNKKKENGAADDERTVFPEINPVFKEKAGSNQRCKEKQRMTGKGGGKVQTENGKPCPCHAASGTGDSGKIPDGTSGRIGNQIVGKTDQNQVFQF